MVMAARSTILKKVLAGSLAKDSAVIKLVDKGVVLKAIVNYCFTNDHGIQP